MIYALAGQSIRTLFVFLLDSRPNGVFLCRIDIVDRIITSEDWCESIEEAQKIAAEQSGQTLEWKNIPQQFTDPIAYIFEREPRLIIKLDMKGTKEKSKADIVVPLVWIDFVLTSFVSLLEHFYGKPELPQGMEDMALVSPGAISVIFFGLNFLFTLAIAFKLPDGSIWARKTYFFSCIFTIVPILLKPAGLFAQSWMIGVFSILQAGVELYALYKLYTGEYGRKFRKR